MFDEGVEAVIGLLTQDTATLHGDHVRLILTSTLIRVGDDSDLGSISYEVQRWSDAGLDMLIFRIDPPYHPALLDRLAGTAAPLAG